MSALAVAERYVRSGLQSLPDGVAFADYAATAAHLCAQVRGALVAAGQPRERAERATDALLAHFLFDRTRPDGVPLH